MNPIPANIKPWRPDKPVSKGATAFHEAVVNSSWINDILIELSRIAAKNIKNGDIVVDFGAGTGTSAMLLLKNLKKNIKLWLVDNSPSWLGKAYDLLKDRDNVEFFILEKKDTGYATLSDTVGNQSVDHVISANTLHLIPDIDGVLAGVSDALKKKGSFIFQTGNFMRSDRPKGALMIDDTVKIVHDIAIDIVRTDSKFAFYREGLDYRIKTEGPQRKIIFPEPRPVETYLKALKKAGFEHQQPVYIPVKVRYDDWLNFLRVKRLQAGILPEIGGKQPSLKEEDDRDFLITQGALKLFKNLQENNPLANDECFLIDVLYLKSFKK